MVNYGTKYQRRVSLVGKSVFTIRHATSTQTTVHTVAIVKFGFSFSTKSHAAFSAKVLLALYPFEAFWRASSSVIGFQSFSLYW
jgi:hypothetical protein